MRMLCVMFTLATALLVITSCTRSPGGIAPSDIPLSQGAYTELGRVEASDCKVNLLGLIPISGGNRIVDAMRDAREERTGTNALVDISVDRVFKYFILWSQVCTEVRATAVSVP